MAVEMPATFEVSQIPERFLETCPGIKPAAVISVHFQS